MTRAITVRLDEADYAALQMQSDQLRLRPGTLARILVHAGLSANPPVTGSENARAAIDRLVRQSQKRPAADAVALVADARAGLEPSPWSSPTNVKTWPGLTWSAGWKLVLHAPGVLPARRRSTDSFA